MQKLKILIYGDYFKWNSGYAREIRDILPLLKKNNEVRLFALDYNGYPVDREEYVYQTKTPDVKDRYAVEILHYVLNEYKPDIVLTVQDFWMLPKISFALAHPGTWKWVHWGTLDSEPLDFYSRESLNWMHYCFFQSHFAAIEVKSVNSKVIGEVIYPSVDPKVFHILDKKKLKSDFKLDDFTIFICNARGQQRKNVPVLLDAFKEVINTDPRVAMILASGITQTKTDDGHLDGYDLDRFIMELGISDNILLPRGIGGSPISDDTLNIQYNLADINILPSIGEGFGLPFIEAGINKVPSIGVDHSAVREIVRNRGILVKPRTYSYNTDGSRYYLPHPDDLRDAMLTMIKDKKQRKIYGEEAYKLAVTFTPESRAEQMLKVFNKLIKENTKPAALR